MVRRFYVHNFRCLENFELPIAGKSSVLLIGNNGSGKSTVAAALEILQRIARGTSRVEDLVNLGDLARGRVDVPVRFEIEVELEGQFYEYVIAIAFFKARGKLFVLEEKLSVGGSAVYRRAAGQSDFGKTPMQPISETLVALPILQESSTQDPLFVFKRWLGRMLILRPVPPLIGGDSVRETLQPDPLVTNLGAWFTGLLAYAPAVYGTISGYLKQVMSDFEYIKNPVTGTDRRSLEVQFASEQEGMVLSFARLSDGGKCFMICALVLAANEAYGPLLCFWDEPDNYLALSEVGHFVLALRKAFQSGGQFIATSHNPEAIRRFSDENTLVLQRTSHLEPTVVRPLNTLQIEGNLVSAVTRGDVWE